MKGARTPVGYTIIEVMIVLAISGVMFLIAIQFISGKQQHTSFVAGVDQMTSLIQDAIQQVSAGEYSDAPIDCQGGQLEGQPPTFPFNAGPLIEQGSNAGCVYVGKFLQFWPSSPSAPTSSYEVFTLAGNRLIGGTLNPATTIQDVDPIPVFNDLSANDLTVQATIPQSLTIDSTGTINGITVVDTNGNSQPGIYGFGFMQSLGAVATGGSDDGTYLSGGQTIDLIYNPSLSSATLSSQETQPPPQEALVDADMIGTTMAYASSAVMCLTNGTQFATISIGYTGSSTTSQNLNVTAQIIDGPTGYGSSACGKS